MEIALNSIIPILLLLSTLPACNSATPTSNNSRAVDNVKLSTVIETVAGPTVVEAAALLPAQVEVVTDFVEGTSVESQLSFLPLSEQCAKKGSGWTWLPKVGLCEQVISNQTCAILGASWILNATQNGCVASVAALTVSASTQCNHTSGMSWDTDTSTCDQIYTPSSAATQCTATAGMTWNTVTGACDQLYTTTSAATQCNATAGMTWNTQAGICDQTYTTSLAQAECVAQDVANGSQYIFATSFDKNGQPQYLCYEVASVDAINANIKTQAACAQLTDANGVAGTWTWAGGQCFLYALQESGSTFCTGKGAGWSLQNGICTQAVILSQAQCLAQATSSLQVKWDVNLNQCIQYLNTPDPESLTSQQCSTNHPASPSASSEWLWVTTATSPAAGSCVEIVSLVTTQAQCNATAGLSVPTFTGSPTWTSGETWQYNTGTNQCVANPNLVTSQSQCSSAEMMWDVVQSQCIQYLNSPDGASTTQSACSSNHPASATATSKWTWVHTATSPAAGSCVEVASILTTLAQCNIVAGLVAPAQVPTFAGGTPAWTTGETWQYNTVTGQCIANPSLVSSQSQCTGTQTMWDVVQNECFQYISVPDAASTTAALCTSNHPFSASAASKWIWVTTATSPAAGSCVEVDAILTTLAQCNTVAGTQVTSFAGGTPTWTTGETWQYNSATSQCVANPNIVTAQQECAAADAITNVYTWQTNSSTCVQTMSLNTLQAQCNATAGFFWNSATHACQSASMLTQAQCSSSSYNGQSSFNGQPLALTFNNTLNLCVTANTGEALCRSSGFIWNYASMSCQYCPSPTQDLFGFAASGAAICKSAPYISIGLGFYHGCARLRTLNGYPEVQCWGGIYTSGSVPPGESPADTTEARTMRTALTEGNASKIGHLVPAAQEPIRFIQTPTNNVKPTSPIVSLAVGAYATCAIVENTLQCWGRSDFVGGAQGSSVVQWINEVIDLTPTNPNLRLKKVVVTKTDPTYEQYYETFCALGEDYTFSPPTNAIYCWGNLQAAGLLSNGATSATSPQLIAIPSGAPTGIYGDITVGQVSTSMANQQSLANASTLAQTTVCIATLNTTQTYCWGSPAGVSPFITSQSSLTGVSSYSNSGYIGCYLKSGAVACQGVAGIESGNMQQTSPGTYTAPVWNPTVLLGTSTITNQFAYDFPENPITITFTSPFTASAIMTATTPTTATYTQTSTGTATKVGSGTISTYSYAAPFAGTPRSSPNPPITTPATFTQPFTKVVTLRSSACGLDDNGNVWCWGECRNTNSVFWYPGGPGYCRSSYPDDSCTALSSSCAGRDLYSGPWNEEGRFSPTRVAWSAGVYITNLNQAPYYSFATIGNPYTKVVGTPLAAVGGSTVGAKLNATIPYIDHVVDIFPGIYSICALRDVDWNPSTNTSSGSNPYEIFCWGSNQYGILGDGTNNSTIPNSMPPIYTTAVASTTSTNTATNSVTNGTTTTFTATAITTTTYTISPPTITATAGSYIGAPVFSLPK